MQKASRTGTKLQQQPPDEDGFAQPRRNHTAKGSRACRHSGSPTSTTKSERPRCRKKMRRPSPSPPVVIKWTGASKKIKTAVKCTLTIRMSGRRLCHTVEDYRRVMDHEEPVSPEGSLVEEAAEEEEAEPAPANTWEARVRQQRLLHQFDAVHDEAQRLRVMNLLLQAKMRRYLKRRAKSMGSPSSSFSVRHQLEAEMNRAALEEEELQQRLDAARQLVAQREAQLQQLQERAMSRLRAPPGRRQEAERMLKRVWPQLQRLCKERLLHSRAKHEVESARQQVAELDVFGPQRTLAAYEEMEANAAKLAEREQERAEQLYTLGSVAERDLQQAAHLEDTLLGTRQDILEARRRDVQASVVLRMVRSIQL
ncbi:uncharacterized protein LOC126419632 [Schistocerca serialis cubense]|uniref:uncharacterized protein LOC126419632 n=1 Tax=Schistocerca serialis cubense TaxID=2023355 RepID=UPI00214E580B|nr:uncharacterized protein LOC126419632 [Schistocerca serialis cubense]